MVSNFENISKITHHLMIPIRMKQTVVVVLRQIYIYSFSFYLKKGKTKGKKVKRKTILRSIYIWY